MEIPQQNNISNIPTNQQLVATNPFNSLGPGYKAPMANPAPFNNNNLLGGQVPTFFSVETSRLGGPNEVQRFPQALSPQAPPLMGPFITETVPAPNTIVFSSDPYLSTTTTTTTGIAEVKLEGNKMTITTNVSPFPPDKIQVIAQDNRITIRAMAQEDKDANGFIRTKEFHRQYLIPMGCDTEKMRCAYENGLLRVKVQLPNHNEKILPIDLAPKRSKDLLITTNNGGNSASKINQFNPQPQGLNQWNANI